MATTAKKKTKRNLIILAAILIVAIIGFLVAHFYFTPAQAADEKTISVGVVGNSDDDIWKAVQAQLDANKADVHVKIVSFQDGKQANEAVDNGELDLAAFQHQAFLDSEIKAKGYKFDVLGYTYIMPLDVYSDQYKNVKDIPNGGKIAIPDDATNTGRALKVLESAGLIKLDASKGYSPSVDDITSNPKNLDIQLVAAAQIIQLLPDYAAGITNTNFVVDAGKSTDDAIYAVSSDINSSYNKPYLNNIVSKKGGKSNSDYQKIVKAYHSERVAKAIEKAYKGAVNPAFTY